MRMIDLIEKKKKGGELSAQELHFLVQGFTKGTIPDYQMAAFAMAVCFCGMTHRETAALTMEMAGSGELVDLSELGPQTVDKHSTGGVGDKTTLIVAPLVAALGGRVAKMSGRGLGHTGGTVDKLESIPGYQTELAPEQLMKQVKEIGIAVVGQSGNLAPADKKLYALRDVTATEDSIPLIASSIMSKKLAAGANCIVLDVKVGSGAFMKKPEDAFRLAEEMVEIGRAAGRRVSALITNMDLPLGRAVGNALEVEEAVAVLQGGGPADLREICLELAAEMLALCNDWPRQKAMHEASQALADGRAWAKMREWIECQGGDSRVLSTPGLLPRAAVVKKISAPRSGYIHHMDAEKIGLCAGLLGAGRAQCGDPIDFGAGLILLKKTGEQVKEGEEIASLYTSDAAVLADAEACFLSGVSWGAEPLQPQPLIYRKKGGNESCLK